MHRVIYPQSRVVLGLRKGVIVPRGATATATTIRQFHSSRSFTLNKYLDETSDIVDTDNTTTSSGMEDEQKLLDILTRESNGNGNAKREVNIHDVEPSSSSAMGRILKSNVTNPVFTRIDDSRSVFAEHRQEPPKPNPRLKLSQFNNDPLKQLEAFARLVDPTTSATSITSTTTKKKPIDKLIVLNTKKIYEDKKKRLTRLDKEAKSIDAVNVFNLDKHKRSLVKSKVDTKQYVDAIDSLKPADKTTLPSSQYDELCSELSRAFTKPQLTSYVKMFPVKINSMSKMTKSTLAQNIISKIWQIQLQQDNGTGSERSVKDLIREEVIPLTAKQLKLLLSDSGVILFNWRAAGADISIDDGGLPKSSPKMTVRAPINVINYIKVSMNNTLDTAAMMKLDLSQFASVLGDMKFLEYIGSLTDVVPEIEGSSTLFLTSLKPQRLVSFKQLLAAKLYQHNIDLSSNEDFIFGTDKNDNSQKFETNDDESIPEIYNTQKWFRIKQNKLRKPRANDEEIFDDVLDYNFINDDIKDLMIEQQRLEPVLEEIQQNSFQKRHEESVKFFKELDGSLDLVEDEFGEIVDEEIADKSTNTATDSLSNDEAVQNRIEIPDVIDISTAYDKIVLSSSGCEAGQDERMITAAFGQVLTDESESHRMFNAHLPYANKTVAELPLYHDKSSPDKDNFDYLYVIKLIPDLFTSTSSPATPPAPPIEFWFETEGNNVSKKSIRILQTTFEANMHYSLPTHKSDLKLSSNVVQDIETNFNSSQFLNDQQGIHDFLDHCEFNAVDFKESNLGDARCKIRLNHNGEGGGEEVEYMVVSTQQRKQLELNYEGHLLQYNVIDNGHYHGKTMELNLIGNLNHDEGKEMTIQEFEQFVSNCFKFIKCI